MKRLISKREVRHKRVRSKVKGVESLPRLSVFRSNKYLFVQLINDVSGKTLGSISDMKMKKKDTKTSVSKELGLEIAKIAKKKGINKVVFDRGGYKYHGRIKALADGAREGGLEF